MNYIVKRFFRDLKDNNRPYNAGDKYPREGLTVTPERLAELASANNKQHTPLIEEVEEKEEKKAYSKNDIYRMAVADLKELAKELGLDDELSGAKLKPLIVERLGL